MPNFKIHREIQFHYLTFRLSINIFRAWMTIFLLLTFQSDQSLSEISLQLLPHCHCSHFLEFMNLHHIPSSMITSDWSFLDFQGFFSPLDSVTVLSSEIRHIQGTMALAKTCLSPALSHSPSPFPSCKAGLKYI